MTFVGISLQSEINIAQKQSSGGVALLEIFKNSQENTCTGVSFLIKLQVYILHLYEKRQSGIGVFKYKNFYRAPTDDCF